MPKADLNIDKIIQDVSYLKVGLDPKYFNIKELPILKEKINSLFEALPELTSSYTAFKNVTKLIGKSKNGR